jgi:creatinine amidohydrolase/Fe(II)-dependent formamide hydrolase-like protein
MIATMHSTCRRALCAALLALAVGSAGAAPAASVYLEDLTWMELRDRIAGGSTTVIIPVGGTEQSGPQIALGKHNSRAHDLAGKIAAGLGNAIVAPVIAYVPEGSINPPAAHMRFPGTISISDATFDALLASAARSFKQAGFRDVVFIGDHGGYQKELAKVADQLDHEWAADPACRAYALLEYYRVTQTRFVAELKRRGLSDAEIGTHAGLADTALSMALEPASVRAELLPQGSRFTVKDGVHGDPSRATAELGRIGVQQVVETSVDAIRVMVDAHAKQIQAKQQK